jgi:hypothetical protein
LPSIVATPSIAKTAPVGEKRTYWRVLGERYSYAELPMPNPPVDTVSRKRS